MVGILAGAAVVYLPESLAETADNRQLLGYLRYISLTVLEALPRYGSACLRLSRLVASGLQANGDQQTRACGVGLPQREFSAGG